MTNVYVSLCFDVLLELLQFGERRGLAKLERIGRRFHQSVENFFAVMPFLRLDLQIRPRFLFIFRQMLYIIAVKIAQKFRNGIIQVYYRPRQT